MKYFNILTFIFIFTFTFISTSISKENLAYINVDYLIQNSNIGKKMLTKISNKDKNNLDNLKKKIKSYKI